MKQILILTVSVFLAFNIVYAQKSLEFKEFKRTETGKMVYFGIVGLVNDDQKESLTETLKNDPNILFHKITKKSNNQDWCQLEIKNKVDAFYIQKILQTNDLDFEMSSVTWSEKFADKIKSANNGNEALSKDTGSPQENSKNDVKAVPTNQDCLGAIPICQNTYSNPLSYSGTGNYLSEISSVNSCLGSGEKNDVWYVFNVQAGGNLNFTIKPNVGTEDYDWAVYDLTTANCADIATNPALEVSCNYSAQYTTYTTTNWLGCSGSSDNGWTGPNGYLVSGCNVQNEAVVPVATNHTFVINVSNFSSSQNGYTIDFGASTATIFDNIPPSFQSVDTPISCGATTLTFHFSENIKCSTVSTADFTITGPGGPYTLTNLTSPQCAIGATFGSDYTLTVSPALLASGAYTLTLVTTAGSVSDACLNVAPTRSINFNITPSTTITTETISNITTSSATSGGNIMNSGCSPVTARGVCWNTSPSPVISNFHTVDSSGIGTFMSTLSGLLQGTTYYVRAYACTVLGTTYGSEKSFTTLQSSFSVSGNLYYNNSQQSPISSVLVILKQGSTMVAVDISDSLGRYELTNINNGDYNMFFETTKPWDGVTATDVLKMKRHIIGLELLTEPIRLTAADVNNSNQITATDVLKVQRRISGLDTAFARPDWIFGKPFVGGISITINSENITQNFYGLCTGDVNGSNSPTQLMKTGK